MGDGESCERFRMCLEIKSSRQADRWDVGHGFKDDLEVSESRLEQPCEW